jgi:hypothetical protein
MPFMKKIKVILFFLSVMNGYPFSASCQDTLKKENFLELKKRIIHVHERTGLVYAQEFTTSPACQSYIHCFLDRL